MDVLIQQDGRIQTNIVVQPGKSDFWTVEAAMADFPLYRQLADPERLPIQLPTIRRRFRRLGQEGNVTVWVEVS